jgi:signal transduction histidine kinase
MLKEVISQKRERYEIEFRMAHKSGDWVYILSRANLICDKNGRPVRLIGTHVDMTAFKKMEAQLLQMQKMESIGNLAGGVAHDFNNILSPIIGYSQMLADDLPQDSAHAKYAGSILKAGMRGKDLVEQILTFSRRSEHKMVPVDLSLILQEVITLSRSSITPDIEIEKSIQSGCGKVMADPTQIHQVLMNLATNAFHAVEKISGKITPHPGAGQRREPGGGRRDRRDRRRRRRRGRRGRRRHLL